MGWAFCGQDRKGREIGYGVTATCDKDGCEKEIDRGLAYVCGGMHGDDEISCGRYFCDVHLVYVLNEGKIDTPQLCEECAEAYEPEEAG